MSVSSVVAGHPGILLDKIGKMQSEKKEGVEGTSNTLAIVNASHL